MQNWPRTLLTNAYDVSNKYVKFNNFSCLEDILKVEKIYQVFYCEHYAKTNFNKHKKFIKIENVI